jgi:hypothetical protein
MARQDTASVEGLVSGTTGSSLRAGQDLCLCYREMRLECVPRQHREAGAGSGSGTLDAAGSCNWSMKPVRGWCLDEIHQTYRFNLGKRHL